MKTETALDHFKSQSKIARVLDVSRQYVQQWGEVVPFRAAVQLQDLSKDKIKVDLNCYKKSQKKRK